MSSTSVNSNVVKKIKALIVDDDTTTQMIFKVLLRNFGVETHEAKNGQEAVLAHQFGARFDLIFMDLYMPVMDGCQATKELRDMHICSWIAGVTSVEKEEELRSFMNAGLDCIYQKPLTNDAINNLVEKIRENA